jgi:MFS family permease
MTALLGFVALRVIPGLGAGFFYSNDRSVIAQQSPLEKRSIGMNAFFRSQKGQHPFSPTYMPAAGRLVAYSAI